MADEKLSASRTDLSAFLLDCLDFVECKLREAELEPGCQKAAVIEAGGVFPLMAMRLRAEDPVKLASWALTPAESFDNSRWWDQLASMDRDKFLKEVEPLNQSCCGRYLGPEAPSQNTAVKESACRSADTSSSPGSQNADSDRTIKQTGALR
jgi:hypothetical protein